jgi:hypothetical protein
VEISPDLQEMLDAHKIYAVLTRYCRGLDRCDVETLKDAYWPDAKDDHGVFEGNAHEFAVFMVAFARKYYLATQHKLGNVSYDIKGDQASTEAYFTVYHRISAEPEIVRAVFGNSYYEQHKSSGVKTHDYIFGGRYLDRLAKRNGVWRMISRAPIMDWNIMQPSTYITTEGHLASLKELGRHDVGDPVYRHQRMGETVHESVR